MRGAAAAACACAALTARAQVSHRPSIGKTKALQEPKAWESLLAPSAKSPRTPSLRTSSSTGSLGTLGDADKSLPPAKVPHMLQAATAATQERRTFAIDEAKDEEAEGDEPGAEDDAGVMDEVRVSFVRTRLRAAERRPVRARWMRSCRRTTRG